MATDSTETVIVQRVIPHYRVPLFREIYARLGIPVVTASQPPGGSFLNLADPKDLEFAIPAPFRFPDASNPYSVHVPSSWIMKAIAPRRIVAEFGMRLSSTYELSLSRRLGSLERLAFWSHGWEMSRGFGGVRNKILQASRLPLFSAADAHATYTKDGADWIKRYLPNLPVVPIGNALGDTEMQAAIGSAQPISHGSPQLLAVGRFTADKSFDLLIQACNLVRKTHPKVGLTLIGDGPESARLAQAAGSEAGHSIRFVGSIYSESELAPHFLGADFCVIPGAAGLTVNHALGYNLPVIAFERSASGPKHHPEIGYVIDGQSGVLVSNPTAAALADTISNAYNSGLHTKLREALRKKSPAPTISSVVDNFERLLALMPLSTREMASRP